MNWSAPEPAWISLEHVIPSDHAGVHRLDKKVSSIGRALECDLRLYSASASRQHASIEQRENDWVLVPMEGRRVLVDGELIDAEVVLEPGMRLGLGDDELVVLDQEEPTAVEDEPKPILRAGVIALVTIGSGVALYLVLSILGFL